MPEILFDRVLENGSAPGTGNVTLTGSVTGFRTFAAVSSIGDTFHYSIEAVDVNGNTTGDWETGYGTYSALNTLTRSAVEASSNANGLVNFTTAVRVMMTETAAAEIEVDPMDAAQFFGGGTDGNALFDGGTVGTTVEVEGIVYTRVANTTLVRDVYYNNLRIRGSGAIACGGYRIFVRGKLDLRFAQAGAIYRNGGNGTNSTGTSAITGISIGSSNTVGTNNTGTLSAPGTTGAGAMGTAPSSPANAMGGTAAAGGRGGANASGVVGGTDGNTNGPATGTVLPVLRPVVELLRGTTHFSGGCGGRGGSSGSGAGTGASSWSGGGAGSGGAIVFISAYEIQTDGTTNPGAIQAIGGNGGNAGHLTFQTGAGGSGGGPGGGGGWIYINYAKRTGTPMSLAWVDGGNGGNGGNGFGAGAIGGSGAQGSGCGRVTLCNVTTGVCADVVVPTFSSPMPTFASTVSGTSGTAGTQGRAVF